MVVAELEIILKGLNLSGPVIQQVEDRIKKLADEVGRLGQSAQTGAGGIGAGILNTVTNIGDGIAGTIGNVLKSLVTFRNYLTSVIWVAGGIAKIILLPFKILWTELKLVGSALSTVLSGATSLISGAISFITKIISGVFSMVSGILNQVLGVVKWFVDQALGAFSFLLNQVKRIATVIGVAFVGAFAYMTRETIKFDDIMRQSWAIMEENGKEAFKSIADGIINLSKEVPKSAEDLGKAFYSITSAGFFKAAEASDILRASVKLATAGMSDAEEVAKTLTTILAAYGSKTEEVGKFSDILFQTVKYGKAEVKELITSLGRLPAIASLAGISFEELGGALATLTRQVPTSQAVTFLSNLILNLVAPPKQAAEAMKKLGLSFTDAQGKFVGFIPALKQIKDLGLTLPQLELIVPEKRALTGLAILMSAFETLPGIMAGVAASTGAVDTALTRVTEGIGAQWTLMLNTIKGAFLEVGYELAPDIIKVFKGIGNLADWLKDKILSFLNTDEWKVMRDTIFVVGKEMLEKIGGVLMFLIKEAPPFFELMITGFKDIGGWIFEQVKDWPQYFLNAFTKIIEISKRASGWIGDIITKNLPTSFDEISEDGQSVINWLADFAEDKVVPVINKLIKFMDNLWINVVKFMPVIEEIIHALAYINMAALNFAKTFLPDDMDIKVDKLVKKMEELSLIEFGFAESGKELIDLEEKIKALKLAINLKVEAEGAGAGLSPLEVNELKEQVATQLRTKLSIDEFKVPFNIQYELKNLGGTPAVIRRLIQYPAELAGIGTKELREELIKLEKQYKTLSKTPFTEFSIGAPLSEQAEEVSNLRNYYQSLTKASSDLTSGIKNVAMVTDQYGKSILYSKDDLAALNAEQIKIGISVDKLSKSMKAPSLEIPFEKARQKANAFISDIPGFLNEMLGEIKTFFTEPTLKSEELFKKISDLISKLMNKVKIMETEVHDAINGAFRPPDTTGLENYAQAIADSFGEIIEIQMQNIPRATKMGGFGDMVFSLEDIQKATGIAIQNLKILQTEFPDVFKAINKGMEMGMGAVEINIPQSKWTEAVRKVQGQLAAEAKETAEYMKGFGLTQAEFYFSPEAISNMVAQSRDQAEYLKSFLAEMSHATPDLYESLSEQLGAAIEQGKDWKEVINKFAIPTDTYGAIQTNLGVQNNAYIESQNAQKQSLDALGETARNSSANIDQKVSELQNSFASANQYMDARDTSIVQGLTDVNNFVVNMGLRSVKTYEQAQNLITATKDSNRVLENQFPLAPNY